MQLVIALVSAVAGAVASVAASPFLGKRLAREALPIDVQNYRVGFSTPSKRGSDLFEGPEGRLAERWHSDCSSLML
jgi:hypothetical protein